MGKKPPQSPPREILVICEGAEEFDYFDRLRTIGVWRRDYRIVLKNAGSLDNILKTFKLADGNDNYAAIAIFCDTETAPYTQFQKLKSALREIWNGEICDRVLFFANPCSMQIILLHFGFVTLKTNGKSRNAGVIKELTGVSDYEATERQRRSVMKKVTAENYPDMKANAAKLSGDCTVIPSTNVPALFDSLDGTDTSWLDSFFS